jgi:uncharacterized protein (TIGR02246 family)
MRFHRAILPFAILAALAGACAPATPPPPPDTSAADTAAINKLRSDFAMAWKAGDADRLGTFVTADAALYPMELPTVTGRAAVVDFYRGQFAQVTPNDFVIQSEELKLTGQVATDRGTVELSMTPKAKGATRMTIQARYLVVLYKGGDGTWLLRTIMDNMASPAAPPAAGKGK